MCLFLIILRKKLPHHNMIELKDFINKDFKPIDAQETIESIQDFFAEGKYSHFPVLEEGIYLGSIAADDIETFDGDKKIIDYKYTLDGFFARNNMIWLDVLEVFSKRHTNVVPILDDSNAYVGYYELEDVVKFFYETPFLKEQGGIIVVKTNLVDFSMSQITQIVESNNGKLLGIFISDSDINTITITIKIALGGLNEIIQTFRRYNYTIVSEHNDDSYINNLKERSEYLDRYLNI
ncbi:MAG: CBS domain-containing protein [Flavobacterium sp.]|jgi:CBS domain-containing protein